MLVSARVAFAVRCSQCGTLETSMLSLFDFSGSASVRLQCSCGGHKLTVGMRRGGPCWIQLPCSLCDGVHFSYFSAREFWKPEIKRVFCGETGLQLGVFGAEDDVRSFVPPEDSEVDKMLEEAIAEDYFENPEVMYEALSHIHDLAAAGDLECECGNQRVEVDIFADRLELTCPDCGGQKAVYATSESDLQALEACDTLLVSSTSPPNQESREPVRQRARSSRRLWRKK